MDSPIRQRSVWLALMSIVLVLGLFLVAIAFNRSVGSPTPVVVSVVFPVGFAEVLDDQIRSQLQKALEERPNLAHVYFGATSAHEVRMLAVFAPGSKPNEAEEIVQSRTRKVKPCFPESEASDADITAEIMNVLPIRFILRCVNSSLDGPALYEIAVNKLLPELNRISKIQDSMVLGPPGRYGLRLRLDSHRMRSERLSSRDIIEAATPSSMIGRPPPRSAVSRFDTNNSRDEIEYILGFSCATEQEQIENLILRANQDGEMLRVRDVGDVEKYLLWSDDDSREAPANSVVILFSVNPPSTATVVEQVKLRLEEFKRTLLPAEIAFDFSVELPAPSVRSCN